MCLNFLKYVKISSLITKKSVVLFCLLFIQLGFIFGEGTPELDELNKLAQDLSSQQITSKELSETYRKETTLLSKNLQEQKKNSELASQPSKTAREYLASARQELESVKTLLTVSNNGLESTKKLLNLCLENLENAEKALKSNKEDEHYIEMELGNLWNEYALLLEKINILEKKNKIKNYIIIIGMPVSFIAGGATAIYFFN